MVMKKARNRSLISLRSPSCCRPQMYAILRIANIKSDYGVVGEGSEARNDEGENEELEESTSVKHHLLRATVKFSQLREIDR